MACLGAWQALDWPPCSFNRWAFFLGPSAWQWVAEQWGESLPQLNACFRIKAHANHRLLQNQNRYPLLDGRDHDLISLAERFTEGRDVVAQPEGFKSGPEADFKRSVAQRSLLTRILWSACRWRKNPVQMERVSQLFHEAHCRNEPVLIPLVCILESVWVWVWLRVYCLKKMNS